MADISAARAAVHSAALAREDLLRRAVEGEAVTDDEMLAADLEHEKALRLEKLAEATAAGAYQRAQLRQIGELRKQAATLEADYNAGLDRLVDLAGVVDDKLAEAQEALAAYFAQAKACQDAHGRATYHNSVSISYGHTNNNALRDLPPAQQPKVWGLPQHGFSYPRPQLEMAEIHGAGTISHKRVVVHSLQPRTRLHFNRPIARDAAA